MYIIMNGDDVKDDESDDGDDEDNDTGSDELVMVKMTMLISSWHHQAFIGKFLQPWL